MQVKLDRKSTIKQAKNIRERESVPQSSEIMEGQEMLNNAVMTGNQLPRALSHVYRAKQLQDMKQSAMILDYSKEQVTTLVQTA